MNGASSSQPPPPPPPAAVVPAATPEASSLLAPGFRFHPTDEELVSYYLKRKVFGRPLRVDAIAEVELYKAEPWDLPALSRLRSRDMEWYFFSPLDRKYANRSRTNRATSQGYWKTTGKDRPVRRGPRTVGMKKTLVFHVGRAPRGERTNWVMHEYRLEDGELTNAGIPQDSYVVCRIFQKSGTGPQNGAQYGAPFNEEEWEEEANNMHLAIVDNGDGDGDNQGTPPAGSDAAVVGNGEYFQLSDFAENQDQGNQFETGGFLTVESNGQNIGSGREDDHIFLVEGLFNDQNYAGLLDLPSVSNDIVRIIQPPSPPCQNDEFLELNDIVDGVNMNCPSCEESVGCFLSDVAPLDIGELFDSNENTETPATYEMCPFQDNFYLEPKDLDLGDFAYPSDQTGEDDTIFHDASSYDLPSGIDNFIQMNDLYAPIVDSGGLSAVEDISSYFNNAYNSHYPALDGSTENISAASSAVVESNFPREVRRTVAIPAQAFEAVGTSSVNIPGPSRPNSIKENVAVVPDSLVVESCDRSLTKRLVNMLGSISAPPAYAAEPTSSSKSVGLVPATNSSGSSIHVTAGMIQIRGFEVMGRAEHWSMHRNGDMGFLLSCGVASRKDDGFESVPKIRGWSMSVVLRGGLYCFLLSALVLMLCFKVGIRICSRLPTTGRAIFGEQQGVTLVLDGGIGILNIRIFGG